MAVCTRVKVRLWFAFVVVVLLIPESRTAVCFYGGNEVNIFQSWIVAAATLLLPSTVLDSSRF